jgi:hypothetical protein
MQLLNNLLKDVIQFGKNFADLTFVGQLATAVILIFASYQITSCSKDKELDSIKITAEQTSEYANKITDSLRILGDSVAKKEIVISKLNVEISLRSQVRNVLRGEQSRLEVLRDTLTDTVRIIAVQDTTIDNLKTQLAVTDTILFKKDTVIAQKDTVINLLKTSLSLSETKADTLQKTLDYTINKMKKKDKLFGFIPLPSRKTTALLGLVGGVYLGTQITK